MNDKSDLNPPKFVYQHPDFDLCFYPSHFLHGSPVSPPPEEWNIYVSLAAVIDIIECYKIPVGNSAAGEMACEWTRDALIEIRDEIVKLGP